MFPDRRGGGHCGCPWVGGPLVLTISISENTVERSMDLFPVVQSIGIFRPLPHPRTQQQPLLYQGYRQARWEEMVLNCRFFLHPRELGGSAPRQELTHCRHGHLRSSCCPHFIHGQDVDGYPHLLPHPFLLVPELIALQLVPDLLNINPGVLKV